MRQQQYGWLIFGVSEENKVKHIVGTAYKKGDRSLLEKFKYEIARNTTNGMTFYDIIEIFPVVKGKEYRVLMFKYLLLQQEFQQIGRRIIMNVQGKALFR